MSGELLELERFAFGDSAEMADALLGLVLSGTKTATSGALREYEKDGGRLPRPGNRSIVLDGTGAPACVIEIVDVVLKRFDEVDSAFAHQEGEGDRSLSYWRSVHEEFFRRNGGFKPDMMLVCEKFRVIERLSAEGVRT